MRLEPTFRLLEVPFNINLVTTWLLCHYCGVYVLYSGSRCDERETGSSYETPLPTVCGPQQNEGKYTLTGRVERAVLVGLEITIENVSLTEARAEWAESRVHSQSRQNETGESGNLHISGGT